MSYLLHQKVVMRGGRTQESANPVIATVFENYKWGCHKKLGVFKSERDACHAIIQYLSSKELFTHATIRTAMEFDPTGVVVSMHYDKVRVRRDIAFVSTRDMLQVLFEEYGGDIYAGRGVSPFNGGHAAPGDRRGAAKQWGFTIVDVPKK